MFGSQSLELFIALVTLMFVLSLASSTIVEGGAALIRRRGKKLEESLARLLGLGETKSAFERLADAAPTSDPTPAAPAAAFGEDAASEPPKPIGPVAARVRAVQTMNTKLIETPTIKAIQTKSERFPSYISRDTFLDVAEDLSTMDGVPDAVKARLATIRPDTPEGQAARKKLLRQFDEAMDRLSSAYKRRTSLWLFVVGLFIAVTGNVSVYHVTKTLWSDTVAREAVVEAAKNVGAGDAGIEAEDLKNVGATVDQIADLGLPVGWTDAVKHEWGAKQEITFKKLGMVGGWLATGALVTLGAPFWFDLLNKALMKKNPPADKKAAGG